MQTLPKISASAPEIVQKSIGAVGDMAMSHMAQVASTLAMLEAISACLLAINLRGDNSDQEGSEGLLLISVAASQMQPLPPQVCLHMIFSISSRPDAGFWQICA